jgi:hypothetical protein
MDTPRSLQLKPAHFREHTFTKTYDSSYTEPQIWAWLNDSKTFIDSQTWPYRVEFLKDSTQENDFETGVLNTHHGPFLSLAGEIGEVTPHYRDLPYFYGSYALSFRILRPFRLEFWSEDKGDKRVVTVKLSTYVAPAFYNIWNWSQGIFWNGFGKWMNKSVKRRLTK